MIDSILDSQAVKWDEILESLKNSMPDSMFNQHFLGSTAVLSDGAINVSLPKSANLEMVENRLMLKVQQAVKSIIGQPMDVRFEVVEVDTIPDVFLEDETGDSEGDVGFEGIYHDKRNAIIQPDKIEQYSQYFRKHWRRLLGPTLSELVRELRQRCHSKSGRNTFKVTYKQLAETLGVSERTVIRALEKDEQGGFKNTYLGYFIADMSTVKSQSKDGKIRNEGTRFTVFLDDPLTPNDQLKLTELTK